jgi:hypothetical protein
LLIAALASAGPATAAPTPFRAEFAVYRGSVRIATSTFHLDRAPEGVWRFESETTPAGLVALLRADHIIETSLFRQTPDGLEPLQYGYLHRGSSKDRNQSLTFDWSAGRVRGAVRGQPVDAGVPRGTLDRLLVQIAAGLDLARGALPPAYMVFDRHELKRFALTPKGEEKLEIASSGYDTVLLERVSEDGKKTTAIWYAPALDWAPVRLEQRDEGEAVIRLEPVKFERK